MFSMIKGCSSELCVGFGGHLQSLQSEMFPVFPGLADLERPVIVECLSTWFCLVLSCFGFGRSFTEVVFGEENNFSSVFFGLVFGGQQIKLTKDILARGKKNI